jgi:hypothetical protein
MIQYRFEYELKNNYDVYIAGSFNNWNKIKMYRYGNKYYYNAYLQFGEYQYKFFVNNEWKYNNKYQIIVTEDGYVNNFLELKNKYDVDDPLSKEYEVTYWHL